jgi:hypothetical protein
MGIIIDLLEYIHVKSKSLLEYIYGNNPRSIRDIMMTSKSLLEYIYMGIILDLLEYIHVNKDLNTMAKKGEETY